MRKYIHFFFLSLLIAACSDDKEPSRTIFEFTGNGFRQDEEWWIILHDDESGELITSQQVTKNGVTTFVSDRKIPGGKLTVTMFRATTSPAGSNFAEIHRGIDVGSKWTYRKGFNIDFYNNDTGTYFLEVTNAPSLFDMQVSDGLGQRSVQFHLREERIVTTVSRNGASKHLVTLETLTDHPKYYMLNDLTGDKISVDYSSFKDFDKYVTVKIPEGITINETVAIGGYQNVYQNYFGYTLKLHYYDPSTNITKPEVTIGLLNSIPNYAIYISSTYWSFRSMGEVPSLIEYVSQDGYSSTGTKFDDYKITASKDYAYSISTFGYSSSTPIPHSVVLTYYAAKGHEKPFKTLTPEIEAKYGLDGSKLRYYFSSFVVTGRSYEDYVRNTYDATYDDNTSYFESIVFGGN